MPTPQAPKHDDYYLEQRRDRIAKTFKHIGKTGTFFFLYLINEEVPSWDERFMEL